MVSLNSISPGDVIDADLGSAGKHEQNLDSVVGHEQAGKRPCIVVSFPRKFKDADESLDLIIIMPVTSKKRNWWTVVKIDDKKILPETSYALCHNIRSISIERVLGKRDVPLTPKLLTMIRVTLREVLELN